MEPAPEDAPTFTKEHQIELHAILDVFQEKGLELEAPFMACDAVDAVSGYIGQLIIPLAQIAASVITGALVAWLKGRPGRKVRVEFHPGGTLKRVEAPTPEQVVSVVKELDEQARTVATKKETQ